MNNERPFFTQQGSKCKDPWWGQIVRVQKMWHHNGGWTACIKTLVHGNLALMAAANFIQLYALWRQNLKLSSLSASSLWSKPYKNLLYQRVETCKITLNFEVRQGINNIILPRGGCYLVAWKNSSGGPSVGANSLGDRDIQLSHSVLDCSYQNICLVQSGTNGGCGFHLI